jgi:predicted transposase/invertase (TIGR01784 family)
MLVRPMWGGKSLDSQRRWFIVSKMETDSFFCQLLQRLPETLFELLGLPGEQARDYVFDSVEIKKSLRIDGLFRPKRPPLPAYFVEVKFQRQDDFYANLFAKVFLYMQQNPAIRDWRAVAIFENRRIEPSDVLAYEDLLKSRRVVRIYLDDHLTPRDPPFGLGILQMVTAAKNDLQRLVKELFNKANDPATDSGTAKIAIELTEELLVRRFATMKREEIRKMFQLTDIRKTAVWQEAKEEGLTEGMDIGMVKGIEKGIEKGAVLTNQRLIRNWLAKGKSIQEIADLLDVSVKEAKRLVKSVAK